MARDLLTVADIEKATCPEGKAVAKLFDGDGVELWVTHLKPKRGRPRKDTKVSHKFAKRWRYSYRFAGCRNSLTLGTYPTVKLADARRKADELRKLVEGGTDPAADRRSRKATASNSFDALANAWLGRQNAKTRADSTIEKLEWLIGLVRPKLGRLVAGSITPRQVLDALEPIAESGRKETARRCRSVLGRVFRFGVASSRCEIDPTASLKGDDALPAPDTRHMAAVVEPKVFGKLLRDIAGYHGQPETRLALQLLTLSAMRPGELRQLRWSWIGGIDFETGATEDPVITLPAEIMKMRRPHVVPLSTQAVALIVELRRLTGGGEYLFPSSRDAKRPMNSATMNSALASLGYDSDTHVPHGGRSSFSTMANEAQLFDPMVVEVALAHKIPGSVAAIYNRAQYLDQRRRLMQWWSNRCDEMREETGAKVVTLRPAVA
jgi:integrase